MSSKANTYKLNDEFETVVRTIDYLTATIRIETWKSLGYRNTRKSCEIRFPGGEMKKLYCMDDDPKKFSRHKTNAALEREAKELIRKQLRNVKQGE